MIEMDENGLSETSDNPAIDRDIVDVNSKSYEMLKNDSMDEISVGNGFSDAHGESLLNEASKIFQIGIEKDFIIWEKSKIIEDAMETVDNMKKNIYHIQTEYEKLDQNYQKEISNSAEALKRMDITRNMSESTARYAEILATSIRQLEDDKFKIVEFYNELHMRLDEEEEKRKKIELIIKEQEDFAENRVSQLLSDKEKAEEKLNMMSNKLSQIEKSLKYEMDKKAEIEADVEKYRDEMKEMKSNLLLEQTTNMKYRVNQSHLKKKILQQKAENEKTLNLQKISHKRQLKLVESNVMDLRKRLDESQQRISNYLSTIKELDNKVMDLNDNLQKKCEKHASDVKEFGEKLQICLTENCNLRNYIRTVEKEKIDEDLKIKTLIEENVALMNMQETIKLKLHEKENEIEKLLEHNSKLEGKVEEILLEVNSRTEKITDLEMEIQSRNTEELTERIMIYEEKLLKCDTIEKELRNEIVLLNETMSKECCENEKIILENRTIIQRLEKQVSELQAQKEAAEKELRENYSAYNLVQSELTLKSADLEKITEEFESKMKMISSEAELSDEYKKTIEKEKQMNKELIERVHKLEDEKIALDRDLMRALDREKTLSECLSKDKVESENIIRKLNYDIEQGEILLKSQKEKLNRTENQILEMEKLSEKLKSSEETINILKKSLESSEAHVEAYKKVIQKLEGESIERKNNDNETIMRLQSENSQLKQFSRNNDFSLLLDTPKSRNARGVNKNENENVGIASKRTPTTSRRLLSTPKRLLESPYPSPNFKSISPIMKTRDPYDYESDGSVEQLNPDKVSNDFRTSTKKGIFTSKRKK